MLISKFWRKIHMYASKSIILIISKYARKDVKDGVGTSPGIGNLPNRSVYHPFFRFQRNTGYFWPTEPAWIWSNVRNPPLFLRHRKKRWKSLVFCGLPIPVQVPAPSLTSFLAYLEMFNISGFWHRFSSEFWNQP